MSYDVYLEAPSCEHCKRGGETRWDANMTSNVSGIWWRALLAAKGVTPVKDSGPAEEWDDQLGAFGPLRGIASDAAGKLCLVAAAHIEANPAVYRPFEPDNGWGDALGAARFLREMGAAWLANPGATLRVSR